MPIEGRVAITGRPGVGKTTLVERVLAQMTCHVGGFLTKEVRKCGHRVGFALVDLATGDEHMFARVGKGAETVGRYAVDARIVEEVGVAAAHRAIRESDLIVIDEIAPMELRAPGLVAAVEAALASNKALLITTHAHATHAVADRVRQELHLVRVRLNNRDALVDVVVALLRGETPPEITPRSAPSPVSNP